MAVAGVVVDSGEVDDADGVGAVGEAARVAAADVGVGDEVAAFDDARANAFDVTLHGVDADVQKMNLVASRLGVADEMNVPSTGESHLDCEVDALTEVFLGAIENFAAGLDGSHSRVSGV